MRFLFIKSSLDWPRTTGHDVHSFEMMRTLASQGHQIHLLTETVPPAAALTGLALAAYSHLDHTSPVAGHLDRSYLQERFRRYWGIAPERLLQVRQVARQTGADVVVAVGLEALPYLTSVDQAIRIWYAADEWVWHHVSQLASAPAEAWDHVRAAAVKGVCERAHASVIDRIWVVSESEQRAMRWVTGVRAVDVVPNGVDGDAFSPTDDEPVPNSAVFWGRLSFPPNTRALNWFCLRVWPRVRAEVPVASFAILGSDPPTAVTRLAGHDGVALHVNLPDLRRPIGRQSLVVLPFVSAGGIKNKLLEAAAMAKPIVATPKALAGLRTPPPVMAADSPQRFADAMVSLWGDPERRRALGTAARHWVKATHTWDAAAAQALRGIDDSLRQRSSRRSPI